MIVRFHFSRDAVALVKFNDARVVLKNANAPWRLDLFGGFGDVGFEEALDFFAVDLDFALKRFVAAVLTPRLTYRLQLHIGGISFFFLKISLNNL